MTEGWVVDRTGVAVRHVVAEGERTTTLGVAAAKQALEIAKIDPKQLDLVICATMTAEMPCPATSQRIAAELGAAPCGAFDLTSACTGYLSALHMAANGIRCGAYRHVLVVGSDVLSDIVDENDPKMAPLFGDAAAAAVIVGDDDPTKGCIFQRLHANGGDWAHIYQPAREADLPPGVSPPERYGLLTMNGLAVYRFAVETLVHMIPETLEQAGLKIDDVDLILLHQSNLRIIERVRDALGLKAVKCPTVIEWTGNTSGGSLGLLLDEMHRGGRLRPGKMVLLAAVGGGLSWGASLWKL